MNEEERQEEELAYIEILSKIEEQPVERTIPLQDPRYWIAPLAAKGAEEGKDIFKIFIRQSSYIDILTSARENKDNEIGGILIGGYYLDQQSRNPFIIIEHSITAEKGIDTRASFTFTHEAMEEVYRIKDEEYSEYPIVGWFHSHPTFGIFLSSADRFIQESFFSKEWQVAYVVDPHSNTIGFFRLSQGSIIPCREVYLFEEIAPVEKQDWSQIAEFLKTPAYKALRRSIQYAIKEAISAEVEELKKEAGNQQSAALSFAFKDPFATPQGRKFLKLSYFLPLNLLVIILLGLALFLSHKNQKILNNELIIAKSLFEQQVKNLQGELTSLEVKFKDELKAQTETILQAQETPTPKTEIKFTYIVRKGDNLIRICRSIYGDSSIELVKRVAEYNNIENIHKIQPRTVLILPSKEELERE